ncbi:hypothetical protein HPP92_028317 [Vanilla planifolia]|uniref:Red chlorophyll catabolite reductase n=1 Tax=Vanilla planifolia TaxID=51239 RepID=A0A835PBD8_VANPL|nr:hypothetical protein HPP92_028317 [Vanilla planifolia]
MLSSMLSFSSHSSFLSCAFLRRSPSQGSSARQGSTLVSMKRRDKDFPFLPPAHRALTLDLFSAIDDRLDSVLLPSTVPSDVLRFQNPQGTAHGSVEIRSGSPTSLLDLVLQSWLHCKLPGGSGEINITTLFGFLNSTSHAPHLLVELIQGGPSSLVLVIDLLPRKDVVLHPDYLDEFYLETNLDGPRQDLERASAGVSLPVAVVVYSQRLVADGRRCHHQRWEGGGRTGFLRRLWLGMSVKLRKRLSAFGLRSVWVPANVCWKRREMAWREGME